MDESEIFTICCVNANRILDHKQIREERLDNDNFEMAWNRSWGLTVNLFKAAFPYEHSYADAIQNELVSVFKWLKGIHGIKKAPFTKESPLPCDLLISVGFLFIISSFFV